MIIYRTDRTLSVEEFTELLNASTLGERRPVADANCIAKMLEHANLLVTAWDGDLLVGASRCLSDFSFVSYCSDLCVRESHQRMGIGKALLQETLKAGGCRVVLLAAPKAVDYYPRIGMTHHPSAWMAMPGELD